MVPYSILIGLFSSENPWYTHQCLLASNITFTVHITFQLTEDVPGNKESTTNHASQGGVPKTRILCGEQ